MEFLRILDYSELVALIFDAKEKIYLSLPGIDEEIAAALEKRASQIEVRLVFDNSEDVFRNGFGEIAAVELLRKAGVKINESKGNMVSFIIFDSIGYYLFPQSKIFSAEPSGLNAVKMDPMSMSLITKAYFDEGGVYYFQDDAPNDVIVEYIISWQKELDVLKEDDAPQVSRPLDEKQFNEIRQNLVINPPLEPDLKRQVNTYNAKIQFVELKFSGGNMENRIVNMPIDALPIGSEDLKQLLSTRIKMFQEIQDNSEYSKFVEFKKKIEGFRKKYLTPITCRQGKSIIKIGEKGAFQEEFKSLQSEAQAIQEMLVEMLETERYKTIDLVKGELLGFFKENGHQEIKESMREELKNRKLEEIVGEIISKIKFPDVSKLVAEINLNVLYYDLTINDFTDKSLIKELESKEIMGKDDIESIVSMKDAFEARK